MSARVSDLQGLRKANRRTDTPTCSHDFRKVAPEPNLLPVQIQIISDAEQGSEKFANFTQVTQQVFSEYMLFIRTSEFWRLSADRQHSSETIEEVRAPPPLKVNLFSQHSGLNNRLNIVKLQSCDLLYLRETP